MSSLLLRKCELLSRFWQENRFWYCDEAAIHSLKFSTWILYFRLHTWVLKAPWSPLSVIAHRTIIATGTITVTELSMPGGDLPLFWELDTEFPQVDKIQDDKTLLWFSTYLPFPCYFWPYSYIIIFRLTHSSCSRGGQNRSTHRLSLSFYVIRQILPKLNKWYWAVVGCVWVSARVICVSSNFREVFLCYLPNSTQYE